MDKSEAITLTQELVRKPSFTPDDAGCQPMLIERLKKSGFSAHQQRFGEVDNVLLWHGEGEPGLLFLGHTDVVPVGELSAWDHDPLAGQIKNNILYGRGVADMKGSIASMVVAMERFVAEHPQHPGKIGLLLTSDEEGPAQDGIRKMMPWVAQHHDFAYCLVGEPSSSDWVGDTVRSGRRGSLHVYITIHGQQGHVAYPHLAENPVFNSAAAIHALSQFVWDEGNDDFPPTSFQISNAHAGTGAANIIPGEFKIQANFRYSPESNQASLEKQLRSILDQQGLNYDLDWQLSGEPFFCHDPEFRRVVDACIEAETGKKTVFNTAGGTSDGRFVAPFGIATLELGPINKTIHQVNECLLVDNLLVLERLYARIMRELLL
ncbi:succinyl-diaminopimelate desuccinylase [Marinicella sp. W31]|uniref:succinyl-diaminopimelate desuccinylase n=1 Tax=Marinicella sp. W31 TaxID=3023713 RepID=UPI003756818E